MVALALASPPKVKFCNWRTTSFIALIYLGLLIIPTSSTPISRFIPYLNVMGFVYFTCFSFGMSACFSPFNQFCPNIFSNIKAVIRSRFVRYMSQLAIYYVAFCVIVLPISTFIRYFISVLASTFIPPFPSLPSFPSPVLCYSVVACLVICIIARFITKQRVVGLLSGGRF